MGTGYRLKKMSRLASGKILDVGFAAQPNPYLHGDVYGLDLLGVPSPPNYKGVMRGDATNLAALNERFDTIIAGELIEHLENPVEFLKGCYEALRPGGTLVVSTPNPYFPPVVWMERFLSRRFFYTDEHVFVFSPIYFMRALERQGFRRLRAYSGGVPVGPMAATLLSRVLEQRKLAAPKCDLFRLELPFPRAFCYAIIYVGEKP